MFKFDQLFVVVGLLSPSVPPPPAAPWLVSPGEWPSGHMLHKAAGLPELFASLDPGSPDGEPGTGCAGPRRVAEKGTAVGVRPRGHPVRGDAKELGDLFDELDEDGDGLVTFAQYADAVSAATAYTWGTQACGVCKRPRAVEAR